jgi:hypothetical protein
LSKSIWQFQISKSIWVLWSLLCCSHNNSLARLSSVACDFRANTSLWTPIPHSPCPRLAPCSLSPFGL